MSTSLKLCPSSLEHIVKKSQTQYAPLCTLTTWTSTVGLLVLFVQSSVGWPRVKPPVGYTNKTQ